MRITYGNAELAHPDLAKGRVGPRNYSLNGRQVVDEAEFFRALTTTIYGRGGRSVAAGFEVQRLFGTAAAALRFAHTHHNVLPDEGSLRLTLDDETVECAAAVLEAVDVVEINGSALVLRYTFRGDKFEADAAPLPDIDDTMIRRANVAIPADATSVDVEFATPLSGVPFVQVTVLMPTAGGDVITATVVEDTITAAGFTAELSGPPAGSGYKLSYRAEL